VPIGAVQKQFIDELKRVLSQHQHRALTEGAAVTCVKLCKSSTYVNITDRANVLFVLVHTVNQDLKVCVKHCGIVSIGCCNGMVREITAREWSRYALNDTA